MTRLGSEDYAVVIEALTRVSAAADLADFAARVCDELLMLLPGVSTSYNEIDHARSRVYATIRPDPGPEWFERYQAFFDEHLDENPLVREMAAAGDLPPQDWLDVDPDRAFETTPLFLGFYVPNGIRSQLVFTMPSDPGLWVALAVNRDGAGFDARERELIELIRPLLGNAYRLVRRLTGIDLLSPVPGSAQRRSVDPSHLALLGLTSRQAEVAALAAAGATNQQIASALGISPGTVRKHLEGVYRSLGVTSRIELALAALSRDTVL